MDASGASVRTWICALAVGLAATAFIAPKVLPQHVRSDDEIVVELSMLEFLKGSGLAREWNTGDYVLVSPDWKGKRPDFMELLGIM